MSSVHVIAVLAVLQFMAFGLLVGMARERYGVKAPAVSGDENFERAFRIQMNTLEQLICFLPALLIAAHYWSSFLIPLLGAVYLVGRVLYWKAYSDDPAKRTIGFLLTFAPTTLLLLAALAGALFK